MIKERLSVSDCFQGDLVLIHHNSRPMKSGWYRLVRGTGGGQIFTLERSIHREFNAHHPSITQTRKEEGVYCLYRDSLKSKVDQGEYELLAVVNSPTASALVLNNFVVSAEIFEKCSCTSLGRDIMKEFCAGTAVAKACGKKEKMIQSLKSSGGNRL